MRVGVPSFSVTMHGFSVTMRVNCRSDGSAGGSGRRLRQREGRLRYCGERRRQEVFSRGGPGYPWAMTVNPIEMQKSLSGLDFPANKEKIVQQAESRGASKEIKEALKRLPEKEYDTPAAISKEIGKGS